ncbi:DddA-like double-stranded DNA deaminase toxin [Amycolatopsis sp. cmx-8-4]|uniref:DddA-like double-stranded DNA deaminase toxin n=1 Tax=Amycolatopsis sp. cmx-8-4 TaxID=2790947 RepID=UPI0039781C16
MPSVREIITQVALAIEKLTVAKERLDVAFGQLEEVDQGIAQATPGTTSEKIDQARKLVSAAKTAINDLGDRLAQQQAALEKYVASLRGQPAAGLARSPATNPTNIGRTTDEPAQVVAARAGLPPPVQPNTGQKTHGRWFETQSSEPGNPISSGKKVSDPTDPNDVTYDQVQDHLTSLGFKKLAIASHVETKLAVRMAKTNLRDVTVTINSVPCPGPMGCDRVLPSVLPPGAILTVYGTTPDGTTKVYRYMGRAR